MGRLGGGPLRLAKEKSLAVWAGHRWETDVPVAEGGPESLSSRAVQPFIHPLLPPPTPQLCGSYLQTSHCVPGAEANHPYGRGT